MDEEVLGVILRTSELRNARCVHDAAPWDTRPYQIKHAPTWAARESQ